MRILHTSDWHLGRTLYEKRRYAEHAAFLEWLLGVIAEHEVEVLLICGDIFDTIAPANRSLQLYYEFLRKARDHGCHHMVVIGGNHDAPSLLDAPRQVLESIGVRVFGGATDDPADEVLLLDDTQGNPALIVCAVPFLRDRDVRSAIELEAVDDKGRRLVEGISRHYQEVGKVALQLRERLGVPLPIVFTGHLFAAGGKTLEADGVRDLYVGTAAQVSATIFPSCADYVALGHLHVPQRVAHSDTIRYSGSPLPMGFSEVSQQKEVLLLEFAIEHLFPIVTPIGIPVFQRLEHLQGDLEELSAALQSLVDEGQSVWVELDYQGTLGPGPLRQQLQKLTEGSSVEILRLRNTSITEQMLHQQMWQDSLEDMDEREVFIRRLDDAHVESSERDELNLLYDTILHEMGEEET